MSQKKFLPTILIPLLVTSIFGAFMYVGWFSSWDLKFSNFFYDAKSRHTGDVVITAIDPKSLKAKEEGGLGRYQEWERGYYATVIQNLKEAGASVVGVDIFFGEPSKNAIEDAKLNTVLKKHSGIVLASQDTGDTNSIYPHTTIMQDVPQTHVSFGDVTVQEDIDNVMRKVPVYLLPTKGPAGFAFQIASKFLEQMNPPNMPGIDGGKNTLVLLEEKIKNPLTGKNYGPTTAPLATYEKGRASVELHTNFFGGAYTIPKISFSDVYNNNFSKDAVKNKIVLVGEMDSGLHDDVYTPVALSQSMPGVELHANAIETFLTGKFIQEQDFPSKILTLLILTFIATCLFLKLRPAFATITLVAFLAGFWILALFVSTYFGIHMSTWYALTALIAAFVLAVMYRYLVEEKSKKYVTSAFSHYISKKLVDKIVENPELLNLGGEKKELTVSFTDIAGFTTLSEKLSPEELVDFLQAYLHKMTRIIMNREGTLDKYIGDAIMAFWGAPVPVEDQAVKACRSILEVHKGLAEVLTPWKDNKYFATVHIRSGIATGEMVVGNFGSKDRFDYTVIGDSVNLGSRLEGVNKVYGTFICVSEKTYNLAKDIFLFRVLDKITVKGKKKPITIYELVDDNENATDEQKTLVEEFGKAFAMYQKKEFKDALKALKKLAKEYPKDPVIALYIERCEAFTKTPPAKDWDGVWEMKSK